MMQICVDCEREIGHPDAEKDAARLAAHRARSDNSKKNGNSMILILIEKSFQDRFISSDANVS